MKVLTTCKKKEIQFKMPTLFDLEQIFVLMINLDEYNGKSCLVYVTRIGNSST